MQIALEWLWGRSSVYRSVSNSCIIELLITSITSAVLRTGNTVIKEWPCNSHRSMYNSICTYIDLLLNPFRQGASHMNGYMLPLSHLHQLLAIRSAGPPRTRPKSGDDPCMYSGIEHGHEFTAGVVKFMFKKNSRRRDQTQATPIPDRCYQRRKRRPISASQ